MKLGIGSYTYTWAIGVPHFPYKVRKFTALDLVKKAAELGVQVVQICDNLPLHLLNVDEIQELKSTAQDLGISIEVGTRGVETEHLRRYLKIAEYLDSDLLRVILQKEEGKLGIDEAYSSISRIKPDLERSKIRLAIENHERHNTKELKSLINCLNSEYVGICIDTVNSFGAIETPEQVLKELAPFMINLHYKDFVIKRLNHSMGFEIIGCPAGQGMLDGNKLKKYLTENGKELNVILELWTPFTETVEKTILKEDQWAKVSIEFLKQWV